MDRAVDIDDYPEDVRRHLPRAGKPVKRRVAQRESVVHRTEEVSLIRGIFSGEFGEGPLIMVTIGLLILTTLFLAIFGRLFINWYTGYVEPKREVQYITINPSDWVHKDMSIEQ